MIKDQIIKILEFLLNYLLQRCGFKTAKSESNGNHEV